MKKRWSWRWTVAAILVAASALVYAVDYLIFGQFREIAFTLAGDVAFLFLYILVVMLVVEDVLSRRERQAKLKKMNMVIGSFFSAVGRDLLAKFPLFVDNIAELAPRLRFNARWRKADFAAAADAARTFDYRLRVSPADLRDLRECLLDHRGFLLALLENPNLLEHERFTDLLWAVFHLLEELEMRPGDLEGLPDADAAHLAVDVKRAYSQIAGEWLVYAQHLQTSYPFLFSLAARINPFAESPSAVVQG